MRILSMINTKLSDDRFLAKLLDMAKKYTNKICRDIHYTSLRLLFSFIMIKEYPHW